MGFIFYEEFKDIFNQSVMSSLKKLSAICLVYKKAKKNIWATIEKPHKHRFKKVIAFIFAKKL